MTVLKENIPSACSKQSRGFLPLFSFWMVFFLTVHYHTAAQNKSTPPYKVYNPDTEKETALQEIVDRMDGISILFFGEEHDNTTGHYIQDTLYKMLLEKYPQVTLSMEMFERDVQLVLDEYLTGIITEAKLIEEARAWNNYKESYSPMVNRAKDHQQPVIAANAPGRYVNLVNREGPEALHSLSKHAKKYVNFINLDIDDTAYKKKFSDAMGEHAHHMGPNMFYAQLLRDETMAESLYNNWRSDRKDKIFHITGRFHSDERLGTVHRLLNQKKPPKLLTISCFSAEDFDDPDWGKYKSLADYIIITP
ncbi:ChaN family lipoprotein [Negadavirga shengliensis]|uniref:ChaN family lipoprotein n=1 Tax=Negadavirga shengliensis TaxID=1389218 RepID=A0ABV9SYB0_9BACT